MPNKFSQFWQELKRRKVIKVMAMYAATAFIIMEAADIMLPRLGLPDWTVSFLIILLIAGFPITILLSWIFDITPEGVRKTDSLEAENPQAPTPSSTRGKRIINNLVILVLFVLVCILVFPKIFKVDKFKEIRDEDGRISVAVMPFENLSGDSLLNVWQGGMQNLLISTLSYSNQFRVRQYATVTDLLNQKADLNQASFARSAASDLARSLNTQTYILGKILKAGNQIRVNAQLVNSETEEIYKTYQIDGYGEKDFFTMADSLASMIRNYLEIKNLVKEFSSPIIDESISTNSAEAFQYYVRGWDALANMNLRTCQDWLMKAIETDPGFIEAKAFLSFTYIPYGDSEQSKFWCDKAYENRDALSMKEKLLVDHLHAYYYETPWKEISLVEQILEIDELNTPYLYMLAEAYYKMEKYEEAVPYFEQVLEIHERWGTYFTIYMLYNYLGKSYHELGNHKRENEIYTMGLQVFQDLPSIIRMQATCALSTGNDIKASQYLDNYRVAGEAYNWREAYIQSNIGMAYQDAHRLDEAEDYKRQGLKLAPDDPSVMHSLAWLLIDEDLNVDEGVALAEKALEQRPDNYHMIDTYGWGLYKQGRHEEALQVLRKSWDQRARYSQVIKDHIETVEKVLSEQQ